ncbi:lipid A biosynthesis lauroyl acyltransferase [Mycobacteroides abscessus subsp. abscessus]|nr:lipid A biosynthesis lauroyl acyltransferase [Mycobacteroides abscessus subsp. abscessus]
MADVFAANIAERPADWHMLQPLWLDDLSEERRSKLRTAPPQEPAASRETDPVGGQA